MMDLCMVLIVAALFILGWGLVHACEALGK